jgi:hypothetical protein
MGSDARAVNAFIGLDMKDSSNRTVDKNGCLQTRCKFSGYGLTVHVNSALSSEGSADHTGWVTSWSARIPSNVAHMYIEVYPFAAGTYGHTDEKRYGHVYRRNLNIPYPARINLRLPLICAAGGTTGTITGKATVAGKAVTLKRIATWSMAPDNNGPNPILGWNIGTASAGAYKIPNLPSAQKYQVIATAPDGRSKRVVNIPVNSCRATPLNFAF